MVIALSCARAASDYRAKPCGATSSITIIMFLAFAINKINRITSITAGAAIVAVDWSKPHVIGCYSDIVLHVSVEIQTSRKSNRITCCPAACIL